METIKEKYLNSYPEPIDLETSEKIIDQMKKCVCKIIDKVGNKAAGAFCKIPFPDINNLLPVLITNNHVIDESILNDTNKKIILSINNDNEIKEIDLKNRISYTNKEYDVTFIEIKNEDNINYYLEYEQNQQNKNNLLYLKSCIYILHYPKGKKLSVSYGILNSIEDNKKYNFHHLCSTDNGSSGGPILNIENLKLIGIHKSASHLFNNNIGVFLNEAINDFFKQYSAKKEEKRTKITYHIDYCFGFKRLYKEEQEILKFKPSYFDARPVNSTNYYEWSATIKGPKGSPYEGGIFFMNIHYRSDYPFKPPKMELTTRIFHPNFNREGKICCCVLGLRDKDSWEPYLTIIKVLNIIYEVMKKPLDIDYCVLGNLEASQLYKSDKVKFFEKAKDWTKKFAS